MKTWTEFIAFNRGLVSRLGLARSDVKRIKLSASTFKNWMPRILGSMMLRPGTGYLGASKSNNQAKYIAFVYSNSDKALIELTNTVMRVWVNDALITRVAVSSAVTNGDFTTDIVGWTDNSDVGGVASWSVGYLALQGTGIAYAIVDQQVTVAVGDQNKEHALRIVIARGPVILRVGSTSGGDEYISQTTLLEGTHSLSFTPTGNFFIEFKSNLERTVYVDSCNVEAAGTMELPTPWTTSDLSLIRWDASADVTFLACDGFQQRRIERRSTTSWSIVLYQSNDGPFAFINTSTITLTPSVLTGNGTLTASKKLFYSTHIGALFRLYSVGQQVTRSMTALNDDTSSIIVTGITTDRAFTIDITGLSGTGNTVILQKSFDAGATWVAVTGKSWTTDTTESYNDGLDNSIVYYRLLCSVYVAGTTVSTLKTDIGSIAGICRVISYTSEYIVGIEVLSAFGATTATDLWDEGTWSDFRGWPSSDVLSGGRLWWAGKDKLEGSVSDAYTSFDDTTIGDSGPVSKNIGSGPVDNINWLLNLAHLIVGGDISEYSCKASSLDEPLTPTNFNPKETSNQGSAKIPGMKVDNEGIFVQRGGTRVMSLSINSNTYDYIATSLCNIIPEIGQPKIIASAVQRQPDTRLHFVRSDGTVAILLFDRNEDVTCWLEFSTDGIVEDVVVLPGDDGESEDHVYYSIQRTINGATVRYLERWAFESQCLGDGQQCMLADSYVTYSGAATTTVTAAHLALKQVCIWADGADVGTNSDYTYTYTLDAAGQCTLPVAVTNYVVGLPYTAQWKSNKLLTLNYPDTQLINLEKNIRTLGVVAADFHPKGLRFGPDFTNLDPMPQVEQGVTINANTMRTDYDENPVIFPGTWGPDSRVCLQAQAPRPVTLLAITLEVDTA